jgi:1-acyl-sn-glycerol-3-phosphate acyltransferase
MLLLRSALFNLLFYLVTAVMMILAFPVFLLPRRAMLPPLRLYARIILTLLRLLCGIRLQVIGEEYLPRAGAALIAAKHQSAFDTLVWLLLVPDACYVLKRELLLIPLWGWFARKSRMIAVDRKGGGKALRRMLAEAQAAAREGRQIVIFPEGTRVAPGQRVRYQPGVVGLAGALKLPVVPVATDSGLFWPRRAFAKRPGSVTVAVLPPLPANLPRQALLPALEAAIETESHRLLGAGKTCG